MGDSLIYVYCTLCKSKVKCFKIRPPGRVSRDKENIRKHLCTCKSLTGDQKEKIKREEERLKMTNGRGKTKVLENANIPSVNDAFTAMVKNMQCQFPFISRVVQTMSRLLRSSTMGCMKLLCLLSCWEFLLRPLRSKLHIQSQNAFLLREPNMKDLHRKVISVQGIQQVKFKPKHLWLRMWMEM
mmetsp:Transcript_12911/g.20697  ORF Transcript_12911/g.20697 Transcript_12911/m.20697 type:complete len:184 (+) Transcript_12911:528-1079(+)